MRKTVVSHPERCLACLTCVVECSLAHTPPDIDSLSKLLVTETPPQSRIFVVSHNGQSVPVQCFHCEDSHCMEVCPSEAIHRNPMSGLVVVDSEKCSRCRQCLLVCPFGLIDTSRCTTGVVKCDGCTDRWDFESEPACVASCPTKAITFEDGSAWDTIRAHELQRPESAGQIPITQRLTREEFVALVGARSLPAFLENAVTTFVINVDRCKACGKCLKTCPVDGISGERKVPHVINEELCIRCGQCDENCPFDSVDRIIDAEMELILCDTCGIPFTTLAEFELASSRVVENAANTSCPLCLRAQNRSEAL